MARSKVTIIPAEKKRSSGNARMKKARTKILGLAALDFILRASIRIKIMVLFIILTFAALIFLGGTLFNETQKALRDEITTQGLMLGEQLSEQGYNIILEYETLESAELSERVNFRESISSLAGSMLRFTNQGLEYAMIVNKKDQVLMDTRHAIDLSSPQCFYYSNILKKSESPQFSNEAIHEYLNALQNPSNAANRFLFRWLYQTNNRAVMVLDIAIPIFGQAGGMYIGMVRMGMNYNKVMTTIRNMRNIAIIILAAAIILASAGGLLLARTITRPIFEIVKVMKRVGGGDLRQQVHIAAKDEIGELASQFNTMIGELREKFAMQAYVSKDTIAHIKESAHSEQKVTLGGKRKILTVWFSDIRGFTSYSEGRDPHDVISMLNKYLSIQAEIIDANHGSVDKFVGDEVMAIFDGRNSEKNAIKTSIEIQQKIQDFNKGVKKEDQIKVGIGINRGECVMGNMGSKDRMDHTVLGDTVNTAARIMSKAAGYEIFISEAVYGSVKKEVQVSTPISFELKGKSKPIKVYPIKSIIVGKKKISAPLIT